jgi:hypothetical protein
VTDQHAVSVFPRASITSRGTATGGETVILAGLTGHRCSSISSTSIGSYSALTRQQRPRALRPLRHAGAEAASGVPTSLWARGLFVYGQRQGAVGKRHFADPILLEHPVTMDAVSDAIAQSQLPRCL